MAKSKTYKIELTYAEVDVIMGLIIFHSSAPKRDEKLLNKLEALLKK